jgi:hypothetical protein
LSAVDVTGALREVLPGNDYEYGMITEFGASSVPFSRGHPERGPGLRGEPRRNVPLPAPHRPSPPPANSARTHADAVGSGSCDFRVGTNL